MRSIAILAFLVALPFWETKPPQQWTFEELNQLFHDSPWAQIVEAGPRSVSTPAVQIYLATATPMRQAEEERRRRFPRKGAPANDPSDEEYRTFLAEDLGKSIVLAVGASDVTAFSDGAEVRRMEAESTMKVGKKKFKITGHFTPSGGDPYLRLVFPRNVTASDKSVTFELYIPGLPSPYRIVEFALKDLAYKGHPEL